MDYRPTAHTQPPTPGWFWRSVARQLGLFVRLSGIAWPSSGTLRSSTQICLGFLNALCSALRKPVRRTA